MMIDFALDAERNEGKSPREAIYQACLLRFRPILMTTMAALFGALPLMLGTGTGSELRHPLGIAIVGGLIVSQLLTLFTTPVIYLDFGRLAGRLRRRLARVRPRWRETAAMNLSAPFIARPVATTLLTIGVALAGIARLLAAAGVAAAECRLSDHFGVRARCRAPAPKRWRRASPRRSNGISGTIADVTEMTSQSTVRPRPASRCNSASTAISTAPRATCRRRSMPRAPICPTSLRQQSDAIARSNPADFAGLILAMTSDTLTRGQIYDAASTVVQQKAFANATASARSHISGSSLPAVRVELNPRRCSNTASVSRTFAPHSPRPTPTARKARIEDGDRRFQIYTNDQASIGRPIIGRWSSPIATAHRCA